MSRNTIKLLVWVGLFAVAMGYLESAVVVYIRALYYPEGFHFPMKEIHSYIMITELFREAATLLMLLGIGIIAGKKAITRFAYFIYAFAIWDICYYVFLKLLIGWPESLLTWDVLFFIPTTWIGPVISPVINSLMMILLGVLIIYFDERQKRVKTGAALWLLLITGSLVMIIAYILDYYLFMSQQFSPAEILGMGNNRALITFATTYVPVKFNWWIYGSGVLMHAAGILILILRNRKKQEKVYC